MIRWYTRSKTNNLVNVTKYSKGFRFSFEKEDMQKIAPSGKVMFGIEGKAVYFAPHKNGYDAVEQVHRCFFAVTKDEVLKELETFAGQHPLFYDGEFYYITSDNMEVE